jgi:hypothetical protein
MLMMTAGVFVDINGVVSDVWRCGMVAASPLNLL